MRDHSPFVIDEFNGWWIRDNEESAPPDHFNKADNIRFFESGVGTRYGIDRYQDPSKAFNNVLRVYDYVMQTGQTLLVLVAGGTIHHVTGPNSVFLNILTIPTMTDFGFVAIAGRAYITPFTTYVDSNGQNYELGLPNEYLYVYAGDGTPARPAGGNVPTLVSTAEPGGIKPFIAYSNLTVATGLVTEGIHVIAVAFSDDGVNFKNAGPISHFTLPVPYNNRDMFPVAYSTGEQVIQLTNIPLGPSGTAARRLLITHAMSINDYKHGANNSFFIAETLTDNITTSRIIDAPDSTLTFAFVPINGSPYNESSAMMVVESLSNGFCDLGFHLVGVVYETSTGYLTAVGPEFYPGNTYVTPTKGVSVFNIPVSPDAYVIKKHLVSTKAILNYNGDQKGYQFFFIPEGDMDNATVGKDVSYYDSDLLADASHLMDNYSRIPAGVSLTTYHSRLVLVGDATIPDSTTFKRRRQGRAATVIPDNRSVAWLSAPGEPEAISKVDGLIVVPLDGNPLTNCQAFRDILYLFKKTRTYAYPDNQDVPASWQEQVVDEGVGASVHGIGTVLDSGGVNIDFLLVADLSGIMLFNGTYARPELSYKIENYWMSLDRNGFRNIQLINDSIGKMLYISLPTSTQTYVLHANYKNGLDPKNIKWARWVFDYPITTVSLINSNTVILGNSMGINFVNRNKTHDSYNGGIENKIPNPVIRTALLGE